METKILKNYNLGEFRKMKFEGTDEGTLESMKAKETIEIYLRGGLNSNSDLIMTQFPETIDLNYGTNTQKKETNPPTYETIARELLGDIYYLMDSRFTQLLINRLVCLMFDAKITEKDFKKFYETTYQTIHDNLLKTSYNYKPNEFSIIQDDLYTIELGSDEMVDFWESYSILKRIQDLKEKYTEENKKILESDWWQYLVASRTKNPEDIAKDIASGKIFLETEKKETITPENFNEDMIKVEYDIYHNEIRLEGRKNQDFIDIAKANSFYWDYPIPVWKRTFFTDYTGTIEDRAAEIISKLLEAGFGIICNNSKVVKKALEKDFEEETPYWVYYRNGGFRATIGDNYHSLKKIKYLKYIPGVVVFEILLPEKIPEFLKEYEYKITESAQKELDKINKE